MAHIAVEKQRGFPAHAGMDPSRRRPAGRRRRFPRPRGDGPARCCVPVSVMPVSPPTRGWTVEAHEEISRRSGFPAHAGMDLRRGVDRAAPARFPRPRGDGPYLLASADTTFAVSPPTRGWTTSSAMSVSNAAGFPAHAGMDPSDRPRWLWRTWFPRPRGDGPYSSSVESPWSAVSPPTRGWTIVKMIPTPARDGFPAHAGMDLELTALEALIDGFPRPRGDGPRADQLRYLHGQVSPPTRGWTPRCARPRRDRHGFPAHAGMDLEGQLTGVRTVRFPRPRGDGPRVPQRQSAAGEVSPPTRGWTRRPSVRPHVYRGFPAHAGMDHVNVDTRWRCAGFPRPRGDGPSVPDWRAAPTMVSPPTRGWTVLQDDGGHARGGFPAHAGMDPPPPMRSSSSGWFPRPRGDGPPSAEGTSPPKSVSPPTRGWTPVIGARVQGAHGFPAHAGMDPHQHRAVGIQQRFPRPRPRGDGP